MSLRRRLATLAAVALPLLAACAPAAGPTVTDEGLAPARHPECAALGPLVLRYLTNGDNEGHPELDGAYAYAVGVPVPVARAKANEATAACDGAIDTELSTKAREAQEQREREQWAAGLDQARAYCTGRGGTVMHPEWAPGEWCKAPRAAADPTHCGQWLALDPSTGRLLYPDITPEECWT